MKINEKLRVIYNGKTFTGYFDYDYDDTTFFNKIGIRDTESKEFLGETAVVVNELDITEDEYNRMVGC
jgi:hypothetical protein